MSLTKNVTLFIAVLLSTGYSSIAFADVFGSAGNTFEIEFVSVGHPGNNAHKSGDPNPAGSVAYQYRIGKYEISEQMIDSANALGSLGITKDLRGANKPVTNVTWYEAARFVNWLNTSTGNVPAYKFDNQSNFDLWNSADAGFDSNNLYRNSLARYFLPSVDEWYKAAYYNPTSGSYYLYPTASNNTPFSVASGTNVNTAVYARSLSSGPADITEAGGLSSYGTMAQGGNVAEWEETDFFLLNESATAPRGRRGGYWVSSSVLFRSNDRGGEFPEYQDFSIGFRVASISDFEPSGDFNGDGNVDGPDFLIWQRGESPNPLSQLDLADWHANYGTTSNPLAASATVPEPHSLLSIMLASFFGMALRHSRHANLTF